MNSLSAKLNHPIASIALLLLGLSIVFAAGADMFPIMGGLVILCVFSVLSFFSPGVMLISVVVISLLIPNDFTIKISMLPRIGPTRLCLASYYLGFLFHVLYFKPKLPNVRRIPLVGSVCLLLMAALISTLFSVDIFKSAYSMISYLFEGAILIYILLFFMEQEGFWPCLKTALYIYHCFFYLPVRFL